MMYAPTSTAASAARPNGSTRFRIRDLVVMRLSFRFSLGERDRVDAVVRCTGNRVAGREVSCDQGREVPRDRLRRRAPGHAADIDQERGPGDDVERGNVRVGDVEDGEDQRPPRIRGVV